MLPPSSEERRSRRGALRAGGRDDRSDEPTRRKETYDREESDGTKIHLFLNIFLIDQFDR